MDSIPDWQTAARNSEHLCDSWPLHHLFRVCVSLKEKGRGFKGRGWGPGQHWGSSLKRV